MPALAFEPATALDLLDALGDPDSRPSPAMLGGSVAYLSALARLAEDLAARGRVLPTLEPGEDGSYVARWRPVLSGADAQRARDLAAAMPPLCRATRAEGEPSAQVLTEALDSLADAAARARLGREPGVTLLPARRGPPPGPGPRRRALGHRADRRRRAGACGNARRGGRGGRARRGPGGMAGLGPGPGRAGSHLLPADRAAARRRETETSARAGSPTAASTTEPGAAEASATGAGTADASETGAGQTAATEQTAAEAWEVELALQSTDDPSLLLSAADIWSGATAGGWAAAGIRHPEEELLAGLGAAARLFPELDHGLRDPAPEAVTLDTEGAFRFLRQTGPLLSGAGFGVLLPDWVRKSRLGLKITTRTRQTPGCGRHRGRVRARGSGQLPVRPRGG